MHIIFNREAAEELGKKFTVLELETFEVDGKILECFCVVPAERVLNDMHNLPEYVELHRTFLDFYRQNDNERTLHYGRLLMGKFGGELDSFYEILMDRIKT
jgi:hypothetical protein